MPQMGTASEAKPMLADPWQQSRLSRGLARLMALEQACSQRHANDCPAAAAPGLAWLPPAALPRTMHVPVWWRCAGSGP